MNPSSSSSSSSLTINPDIQALVDIDADNSTDKVVLYESLLKLRTSLKERPIVYDGMEPSGNPHIAQGFMRAANVNKFTKAGFIFIFWIADLFAMLNGKMGGDLKKIK